MSTDERRPSDVKLSGKGRKEPRLSFPFRLSWLDPVFGGVAEEIRFGPGKLCPAQKKAESENQGSASSLDYSTQGILREQ